jgi:hypothetical protein
MRGNWRITLALMRLTLAVLLRGRHTVPGSDPPPRASILSPTFSHKVA